jgi:hypothetical protein
MLTRSALGIGGLGLATLLQDAGYAGDVAIDPAAPLAARSPQFTPRARRVIQIFCEGGPSQVDSFDPKPALAPPSPALPPQEVAVEVLLEKYAKGLERDRAVDESGHQVSVFGRIGGRPFTLAEMQKLYLQPDGALRQFPDAPPAGWQPKPLPAKKPTRKP